MPSDHRVGGADRRARVADRRAIVAVRSDIVAVRSDIAAVRSDIVAVRSVNVADRCAIVADRCIIVAVRRAIVAVRRAIVADRRAHRAARRHARAASTRVPGCAGQHSGSAVGRGARGRSSPRASVTCPWSGRWVSTRARNASGSAGSEHAQLMRVHHDLLLEMVVLPVNDRTEANPSTSPASASDAAGWERVRESRMVHGPSAQRRGEDPIRGCRSRHRSSFLSERWAVTVLTVRPPADTLW